MFCEPILSLPQKINLESLQKSNVPYIYTEVNCLDQNYVKHNVPYEQREHRLLPKSSNHFDNLNKILSVQTNDYLSCRWNQFLDNVPKHYARIRLYTDYKKGFENRVVRRKILNGQFYGVDNKLAPIPQLSDHHNLGIKYTQKKN